jgi:hypothetical protein
MINNIEIIKPFLVFNSPDDFYIVEIIKRRKENPTLATGSEHVNNYFITSMKDLDKVMSDIIAICDATKSRAYINLNSRSFKTIALHLNKKMGEILVNGDYKYARKAYISEVHSHTNQKEKLWVVDVDWVDVQTPYNKEGKIRYDHLQYDIMKLQEATGVEPFMVKVPTKNGVHLISKAFNLKKFKETYPQIDVHKNSPTLLYVG